MGIGHPNMFKAFKTLSKLCQPQNGSYSIPFNLNLNEKGRWPMSTALEWPMTNGQWPWIELNLMKDKQWMGIVRWSMQRGGWPVTLMIGRTFLNLTSSQAPRCASWKADKLTSWQIYKLTNWQMTKLQAKTPTVENCCQKFTCWDVYKLTCSDFGMLTSYIQNTRYLGIFYPPIFWIFRQI